MPDLDTMRKASDLLQKGRYDDAIAEYRAVLETSRKKNPAVLNLIGDLHTKQGRTEKAFEAYLEACRLYAEEGLFHNGIAVGKKILRMDRDQTEVYGILGNLYARQGLGGDCVKFLREFSRRKEEAGEYPMALAAFAEACEILKPFPEVHMHYGEMLEKVDRKDDAAACYRDAAQAWADRGLTDRAQECERRAASVGGEAPQDAATNMSDIMSLRTLDDAPSKVKGGASDSRDRFWGRIEQPNGLDIDGPSRPVKSTIPWARYDPRSNPKLPPPPPLPPRKKPKAQPALTKDALFVEPRGLDEGLSLETKPRHPAPPAPVAPPKAAAAPSADAGLELTMDFGAGPSALPEAEPPAADLSALPGIVMPPAAGAPASHGHRTAEAPAEDLPVPAPTFELPEPVLDAPADAPADGGGYSLEVEPAAVEDDELAAFFEQTAHEPQMEAQAVVIGDDLGLIEGGDVSEVIADFVAATSEILDLDDHQAHYDLGTTFMEMELFEEAATEFEVAARGEDFALPSQEMLGYCFLRKGQIELAIRELEKGLSLPIPDERMKLGLHYNLGIACSVLDRDEDAIGHFRRILELDPDFRDTQDRLDRLVQSG